MFTTPEKQLLATVTDLQEQQLKWTRDVIAIPTVNPYSGDASAGIETQGQAWMEERCREQGGDVRRIPVPDDVYHRAGMIGPPHRSWEHRENIVAEWVFGNGEGPTLLLNTHMDTVGTEAMTIAPFDPRVEDGILYGRGSSDSKGNLMVGLTAITALCRHAEHYQGRILLESVVDEECNGAGAGTLACCLAGIRADFAICLDGSADLIYNGCNGIATAKIIVKGRGGHSSLNTSVNAIDKAIVVKEAIDVFGREYRDLHPRCAITLGMFHAGTLPAIVPSEAELQLNINYDVSEARQHYEATGIWSGQNLRERFEAALTDLAQRDPWFQEEPVSVDWVKDAYPFFCPADDARSREVIASVHAIAQEDVPVAPMWAWCDATHLAVQGAMPVLGLGSGTPGQSHTAAESARLDLLYRGSRSLALALHRLLTPKPL